MICNHECIDCWDEETCEGYEDTRVEPRDLTPEEMKELEENLPF